MIQPSAYFRRCFVPYTGKKPVNLPILTAGMQEHLKHKQIPSLDKTIGAIPPAHNDCSNTRLSQVVYYIRFGLRPNGLLDRDNATYGCVRVVLESVA